MDNLDTLLAFALFMAFVGALPDEHERENMTFQQFSYAVFYRFLQNACINVRAVSPSASAVSRKIETQESANGSASRTIETSTSIHTEGQK